MTIDLSHLESRIGQEFDGELHLTEEEGRDLIAAARERDGLMERLNEACDAADHLLAHVTAQVGRYLYDAPDTNLVPILTETGVELTGAMWMRLYKATDRQTLQAGEER